MNENKKKSKFMQWIDGEYVPGQKEESAEPVAENISDRPKHHEKTVSERLNKWLTKNELSVYGKVSGSICGLSGWGVL